MNTADLLTNAELTAAARAELTESTWDLLMGAAESETTALRNRMALDSIALRPRVLAGVTDVDTSATFLERRLRLPVLLAEIGDPEILRSDAASDMMNTARRLGIFKFTVPADRASAESEPAARALQILEISAHERPELIRDLGVRAAELGYAAVSLSLVPYVAGRREREPCATRSLPRRTHDTWKAVALATEHSQLPVVVKGVMGPSDAALAVEHGCSGVYVSNYGGRALDHCEGTINVLREVAEAVDGRAEIVVDGGFMRGTDVVKAIAGGASAVAIGRLQGLGLAVSRSGLDRALEILEDEMRVTMHLLGARTTDALSEAHLLRDVMPVQWPHETSAFFRGEEESSESRAHGSSVSEASET